MTEDKDIPVAGAPEMTSEMRASDELKALKLALAEAVKEAERKQKERDAAEEISKRNEEIESLRRKHHDLEKSVNELDDTTKNIKDNKKQLWQLIGGATGLIVFGAVYLLLFNVSLSSRIVFLALIALAGILFAIAAGLVGKDKFLRDQKAELESKIYDLKEKMGQDAEKQYFERLVNMNSKNLENYYALVGGQARNSFWASLIVGLAGFVIIGFGIGAAVLRNDTSATTATWFSTIAGVITEIISGVFFWLYNETVRQMQIYHNSLVGVQNVLLSLRVFRENAKLDDTLKAKILGDLIGSINSYERVASNGANSFHPAPALPSGVPPSKS